MTSWIQNTLDNAVCIISRWPPDFMLRSACVQLRHLNILSWSNPIRSQWQTLDWPCHKQGAEPWGRFYCSTLGPETNETWVSFQIHALLGQFYTAALLRQSYLCCHGRGMTTPIREVTSTHQLFIVSFSLQNKHCMQWWQSLVLIMPH